MYMVRTRIATTAVGGVESRRTAPEAVERVGASVGEGVGTMVTWSSDTMDAIRPIFWK